MSALSTRGKRRRTEIVEIARRRLVDKGLDEFVLRAIAADAGITLGNLQYYFATRDDLLAAVIETEFATDVAIIRSTIATSSEFADSVADKRANRGAAGSGASVVAVARGLVDHWCGAGGTVFATLSMLAYHHPRFRQLNESVYRTFYAELAVLIRSADPAAGEDELDARVRLVTAVLDGVALQNHAVADGCTALLNRATELIAAITSGWTSTPAAPATSRRAGGRR